MVIFVTFQCPAERATIPPFPAEQRWRDELDDIVIKRLGIRYVQRWLLTIRITIVL